MPYASQWQPCFVIGPGGGGLQEFADLAVANTVPADSVDDAGYAVDSFSSLAFEVWNTTNPLAGTCDIKFWAKQHKGGPWILRQDLGVAGVVGITGASPNDRKVVAFASQGAIRVFVQAINFAAGATVSVQGRGLGGSGV